jgi:hypothetical protein
MCKIVVADCLWQFDLPAEGGNNLRVNAYPPACQYVPTCRDRALHTKRSLLTQLLLIQPHPEHVDVWVGLLACVCVCVYVCVRARARVLACSRCAPDAEHAEHAADAAVRGLREATAVRGD